MTWLVIFVLAIAVFAMTLRLGVPRAGISMLGAALLLGLAGYAMQASPGLPGAPKSESRAMTSDPAAGMATRALLSDSDIPPTNQWIVISDAMVRNGQNASAAQVLLGALDEDPENADAWLALGNALVGHADGLLTPAARYAYEQAQAASPKSAGSPYFLGLALAQSGRFGDARRIWADLLAQSPADAPWREMLTVQLARLDLLIAGQASAARQE